jgi:hypothetical protein
MQPLPIPVVGGSTEALRSFLNVKTNADFVLAVSWLLAGFRDCGPYPVLVLSGEQGSAKSTFSAILRALIDPNTAPLRALPREDRDLFIAATNGHVLAFDNVSGLRDWISDTLCRLATGGGFSVRQLYTDQDEMLFDAARPVILNGIEDIVTRPDLADRAIFLTLEPIPEGSRRPEAELWAAFEAECPRILGALLDAMVEGLKRLPEIHLPKLPRMADFALWASACETAIWQSGTFWEAYCGNQDEAVEGVIEADPIAATTRLFMAERTEWTGKAADLLGALIELVDERTTKEKTWPNNARALSGRLRRGATFLRKVGIEVAFSREARSRIITLKKTSPENRGIFASLASSSSQALPLNGVADDGTTPPIVNGSSSVSDGVISKPLKPNGNDAGDADDGKIPSLSGCSDGHSRPCAQCNADDGKQLPFGDVYLHKECKLFWLGER